MSDRPTLETDDLDLELHNPRVLQDRYSEMMEHARKLERERDEAIRQRNETNESSVFSCNFYYEEKLKAERERDEAREKSERYRIEANAMMMQRDEWAAMCGRYKQERDEALMDRANGDIATMTINHYERILRERDEAREAFKIVYNERVQMELERNEWKNKAYSHATDYTLMEAKCFRLEQQLKEYDKLKS